MARQFTMISGPVKRCLYSNPSKPLYLYEIIDGTWGEGIKVFVNNPLKINTRMAFDGFLERDNTGFILKQAQQVPVVPYSLYSMVHDKLISVSAETEELFKSGIQSLFYKEDPEYVSTLTNALLANKKTKEVLDSYSTLSTCSWEEVLLRGILHTKVGIPHAIINHTVSVYKHSPEAIFKENFEANLLSLRKDIAINPYLAISTFGLQFLDVDEYIIRAQPGLSASSFRAQASVAFTLKQLENTGSTIFTANDIKSYAEKVINPKVDINLGLKDNKELRFVSGGIMLKTTYNMESDIMKYITDLSENECRRNALKSKVAPTSLKHMSEEQLSAVNIANDNTLSIITGGPGCGKTYTVNAIISSLSNPHSDLVLLAPTGKAAQRLSEVTGFRAMTIHSYVLGSAESYSPGATVVVDESSMISVDTMHLLVNALKDRSAGRVILVGDTNQLPAVGAGDVLNSLIKSQKIPVSKLTKIMRQGEGSQIVQFAHKMLDGVSVTEIMNDANVKSPDLFISKFPKSGDPINVITKALDSGKFNKFVDGFDPVRDMQVLSPVKQGVGGVYDLNYKLKNLLNFTTGDTIQCGSKEMPYTISVGDKILCTKNFYDHNLVNGDVGIVKNIKHGEIVADIAGKGETLVRRPILPHIELGFATTVHKAQGSEAPVVISVLPTIDSALYERNLLYTAITRAKKLQWIIGNEEIIDKCISCTSSQQRLTLMGQELAPKHSVSISR